MSGITHFKLLRQKHSHYHHHHHRGEADEKRTFETFPNCKQFTASNLYLPQKAALKLAIRVGAENQNATRIDSIDASQTFKFPSIFVSHKLTHAKYRSKKLISFLFPIPQTNSLLMPLMIR